MTNITNPNNSIHTIRAIFHDSIIHNSGDIHMSQYEEPVTVMISLPIMKISRKPKQR
jgi:hypothetical protein